MPLSYSVDLRWRVVWLWLGGQLSTREIGNFLCCSNRTVRRYITLFHPTGDVKAAQRRYTSPRILDDLAQAKLLQLVLQNPGIYLHELQLKLLEIFGVRVHISTICRTLKFMSCTRQVIRRVVIQRSDAMRAKFMADISLMTRQCWFGLMKVVAIEETALESTAIVCVACILLIIGF